MNNMNKTYLLCLIFAIIALNSAYKPNLVKKMNNINSIVMKKVPKEMMTTMVGTSVMLPSIANAADGSTLAAFSTPLIVSFLTIVPFLYYTQALKPKERKVQQIELDENLREKKKGGLFGKK